MSDSALWCLPAAYSATPAMLALSLLLSLLWLGFLLRSFSTEAKRARLLSAELLRRDPSARDFVESLYPHRDPDGRYEG
ncbi:MAG TPA: hypothetical protein PK765_05240 [bacterium]|nr:hypothetical protein [bacterium]